MEGIARDLNIGSVRAPSDKSVDLARTLESLIDLGQVSRVVEVGCGQGRLAVLLARQLNGHGEVLGLDNSRQMVRHAAGEGRAAGLSNLTFEVGDVYDLPLPDGYADVVICSSLLCSLREVDRAVKEMCRVVSGGGLLAVAEPAGAQLFHDPDDKRFAYLSEKLNDAFRRGWKAKGADQSVGLKIPGIFLQNGLEEIAAEVVCQVHLLCDHRRDFQEIVDQLSTEASQLPEPAVAMLAKGGMAKQELKEHNSRAHRRFSHFLSHPPEVRRSGYIRVMSPLLVFVGRKPNVRPSLSL